MLKKKKLVVNCDLCDARKVSEEGLAGYEQIVLNVDVLVVDKRSREILHRLPVMYNVDSTIEAEEEVQLVTVNGHYEITGDMKSDKKIILLVNGSLVIEQGTQAYLENVERICVNGKVSYPQSMAPWLGMLSVNGAACCIPEGCIALKKEFEADRYFHLRAKNGAKYYAERKVLLTDPEVNMQALAEKEVRFVTKKAIVLERLAAQAVELFDEERDLVVIPEGFAYVKGDAHLDGMLLRRYGGCLFIDGNLRLDDNSDTCMQQVERLIVEGKVQLLERQKEAFLDLKADYRELEICKGRRLENKVSVTVDRGLLAGAAEGVCVANSASVRLREDVKPEEILAKLEIKNCAGVYCSPAQRSAVEMVSTNVARITDSDGEDGGEFSGKGILGMMMDAKVVNADHYIL